MVGRPPVRPRRAATISAARELVSPAPLPKPAWEVSARNGAPKLARMGSGMTGDRLACGVPGRGSASQKRRRARCGRNYKVGLNSSVRNEEPDIWQRSRSRIGRTPSRPLLQTVDGPMAVLREGGPQIGPQRGTTARQAQCHPPSPPSSRGVPCPRSRGTNEWHPAARGLDSWSVGEESKPLPRAWTNGRAGHHAGGRGFSQLLPGSGLAWPRSSGAGGQVRRCRVS